jgi:hypothetical protein
VPVKMETVDGSRPGPEDVRRRIRNENLCHRSSDSVRNFEEFLTDFPSPA